MDATILKLLSPSISLRKVNIELEDYSCYSFPALRALEGYIKYLFKTKNVVVDGLGEVFRRGKLAPNIETLVSDVIFQAEVERIFKYFKDNRHDTFHTEQNLVETKIVNDRKEADSIVNGVLSMIETSYENIFNRR